VSLQTEDNINSVVEELIQSQEDKPKHIFQPINQKNLERETERAESFTNYSQMNYPCITTWVSSPSNDDHCKSSSSARLLRARV